MDGVVETIAALYGIPVEAVETRFGLGPYVSYGGGEGDPVVSLGMLNIFVPGVPRNCMWIAGSITVPPKV